MPSFVSKANMVSIMTGIKEQMVAKEEGKGLSSNDFTDEYKQMVDDLAYVPMTIDSFSVQNPTQEMGATVDTVTLNWTLSKDPAELTLDNSPLEVSLRTTTLSGQNITANKTFTLKAVGQREEEVTKTASISFLRGVYWGVAASDAEINSELILSFQKGLQGGRAKTFTVNAGAGQHIFYALPASYGACNFNVGGFDGGFSKVSTFEFTNAQGHAENYDVYKSTNANLGNTTVKVS